MKLVCFGKEEVQRATKVPVVIISYFKSCNTVIPINWWQLSGFLFCASMAGWLVHVPSVFLLACGGYRACGASCWMWLCGPSCWVQGGAAEDSASTWPKNETIILLSALHGLSPGEGLTSPSLQLPLDFGRSPTLSAGPFIVIRQNSMVFLSPNSDLGWWQKECNVIGYFCSRSVKMLWPEKNKDQHY